MPANRLLFQRILTVLIIGSVGFLALRVTAVGMLSPASAAGSYIAGDHPALFLRAARQTSLALSESILNVRGLEIASQEPLAEIPYLMSAQSMLATGRSGRANDLLNESLRRNPRLREARLLLVQRYARAGNTDAMTQQLITLSKLMPGANELLMATLAQLVLDPATRTATVNSLRRAGLLEGVLNTLTSMETEPALILTLARTLPPAASPATAAPWRAKLIDMLVKRRQFGQARDTWRTFFTRGRERADDLLYNPGFAQSDAPPPFNWALAQGGIGASEPSAGNALAVTYYGREAGELASQLLVLPAGNYRLKFAVSGDAIEGGAELHWVIACVGETKPEHRIPISPTGASKAVQSTFAIRPGCPAQWLKLEGLPGDVARTRSVEISQLSLSKV